MEEEQITAYKTLAAHVLITAISDLRSRSTRVDALFFLTSPDMARERALWLSWLGMNDKVFQKLLYQQEFQGQRNRLFLY